MAKSRSTIPDRNPLSFISAGRQEEPETTATSEPPASSAEIDTKSKKGGKSVNDAKDVNDTLSTASGAKKRLPATVPAEIAEGVYRAAYWDRETVADIITEALRQEIKRREAERGEPYPPAGKIRTGRPPKG